MILGRRIYYHRVIGSTNDEAKRLAEEGAPEGTVVLAEEQTAGRGRLGRRWLAPPGSSILMSVLLRPRMEPGRVQKLTMIAALACAEAIEALTPLQVQLKWPNDLYVRGRKVGGILTEVGVRGDRLNYAVVGIGINVNVDFSDLESPMVFLSVSATSLYNELGYTLSRPDLIREILERLDRKYARLKEGHSFKAEWESRLLNLNREVCVITPTGEIEGVAIGVNEDGALLVRTESGIETVWAGDVTLRKV